MKRVSYLLYISILIISFLIFSPKVLATSEDENNNTQEQSNNSQIVKSDIVVNYDNFYKINEEIHKKQDGFYKPNTYMSASSTLSFRDYVLEEVKKHNEAIDIRSYKIPASEIRNMVTPFLSDPEFFCVSQVGWSYIQGGIATELDFTYIMTAAETAENWKIINQVAKIIYKE